MLDHISIGVREIHRSKKFYDAALAPLGLVRVLSDDVAAGYGEVGRDDAFAIKHEDDDAITPPLRLHIAFAAVSREAVRDFHAAALDRGAKDDGAPGIHSEYGTNYFGAFVIDPDGYRIEAVYHDPVPISLIELTDNEFGWMLNGDGGGEGLRLPSEGIDAEIAAHVRSLVALLREQGCRDNWMMVCDHEVVGLCGFKHPPSNGAVEIGYNVWPSRQRLGHASRAVAAMLQHARRNADIVALTAETTTENTPSHRVLEANGFRRVGRRQDTEDGELVLWRIEIR